MQNSRAPKAPASVRKPAAAPPAFAAAPARPFTPPPVWTGRPPEALAGRGPGPAKAGPVRARHGQAAVPPRAPLQRAALPDHLVSSADRPVPHLLKKFKREGADLSKCLMVINNGDYNIEAFDAFDYTLGQKTKVEMAEVNNQDVKFYEYTKDKAWNRKPVNYW